MQWDDSPNGGFTSGDPFTDFVQGELDYRHLNVAKQLADKDSLFHAISKMIRARKQYRGFGRGAMEWIETGDPAVLAYLRRYQEQTLFIVNNLSNSPQTVTLAVENHGNAVDLLTGNDYSLNQPFMLQPYAYLWLA